MPLQTASEFRAEIRSVVVGLVVGVVVWHTESRSDETACRLIETDADQQPQKELNRLEIRKKLLHGDRRTARDPK